MPPAPHHSCHKIRARQCGIENSSSTYIALLDDDDEWLPTHTQEFIELTKSAFIKTEFIFYSSGVILVENGRNIGLHLSYDVKYAGKNYASILVMGLYSDHEMNEPIIQGFNFDLRTGEAVELKDLVRPAGKFWTMVRNEAQASGVSLTEKDVKGFYYDGAVLGLFYGDNREFDLEEDKVLPFMIKNRLEEEFLTSQSKEEKERNAEKKEERKVKTTESEI